MPFLHFFYDYLSLPPPLVSSLTLRNPPPPLTSPNQSGAIIEYLVDTYDKSNSLHYDTPKEKYATLSWLYFQVSGQGPYFGQKVWFTFYHPEKGITSAIDRYSNEIKRVLSVIDRHLKKHSTTYLVGEKCTFADLAFVPWDMNMADMLRDSEGNAPDLAKEYPHFHAWNEKLMNRPAVKKCAEDKKKATATASGH